MYTRIHFNKSLHITQSYTSMTAPKITFTPPVTPPFKYYPFPNPFCTPQTPLHNHHTQPSFKLNPFFSAIPQVRPHHSQHPNPHHLNLHHHYTLRYFQYQLSVSNANSTISYRISLCGFVHRILGIDEHHLFSRGATGVTGPW